MVAQRAKKLTDTMIRKTPRPARPQERARSTNGRLRLNTTTTRTTRVQDCLPQLLEVEGRAGTAASPVRRGGRNQVVQPKMGAWNMRVTLYPDSTVFLGSD